MSQKNVAAAKRIYESRNRGDVDAVLAECDPDVEWHPHVEVPVAHVLTFGMGAASTRSVRSLFRHPGPAVLTVTAALAWWGAL